MYRVLTNHQLIKKMSKQDILLVRCSICMESDNHATVSRDLNINVMNEMVLVFEFLSRTWRENSVQMQMAIYQYIVQVSDLINAGIIQD